MFPEALQNKLTLLCASGAQVQSISSASIPFFLNNLLKMCKTVSIDLCLSWKYSDTTYQDFSCGYPVIGHCSKRSPAEKDLRIVVNEKLDVSHQCALTAPRATCILDCIKSSMASRLREEILPLCSTLRPHPQSCGEEKVLGTPYCGHPGFKSGL